MGAVNNRNDMVCSDYFVVDNMVYMGTVNNCNDTQYVLVCVCTTTVGK